MKYDDLTSDEQAAFYQSGLIASGCVENIDDYMMQAIASYGKIIQSKVNPINAVGSLCKMMHDKGLREFKVDVGLNSGEVDGARYLVVITRIEAEETDEENK
jgi:hypothetical protein